MRKNSLWWNKHDTGLHTQLTTIKPWILAALKLGLTSHNNDNVYMGGKLVADLSFSAKQYMNEDSKVYTYSSCLSSEDRIR